MILPKDIQAAICAKLEEVFPGETVYQDLVRIYPPQQSG